MPTEGIKKVRQAEDKAEDIIDAAAEDADRIIADAKREASRRVRAAGERARHEGGELKRKLMLRADDQVLSVKKATDRELSEVRRRAHVGFDRAVQILLDDMKA
jgi:vacuolar-type H+-ATPase subunit H